MTSDDDRIAEYRAGVRAAGRKHRLAGFGLVILGAVAVLSAGRAGPDGSIVQWAGYAALAGGWALIVAGFFVRTRYQRRRLAELN